MLSEKLRVWKFQFFSLFYSKKYVFKTGYPAGYPESGSGFFLQPDNPESGSGLKITIRYSPNIVQNCAVVHHRHKEKLASQTFSKRKLTTWKKKFFIKRKKEVDFPDTGLYRQIDRTVIVGKYKSWLISHIQEHR